jgi:hypothetical protein
MPLGRQNAPEPAEGIEDKLATTPGCKRVSRLIVAAARSADDACVDGGTCRGGMSSFTVRLLSLGREAWMRPSRRVRPTLVRSILDLPLRPETS